MKKLLVTGSNGFVAGSVIRHARQNWEVHGIARSQPSQPTQGTTLHTADLLDAGAVCRIFHQLQPDAVIHAAAIANIDYCQNNREEAEAINVNVTHLLAQLCAYSGARMVHCSTDTVFDGVKGNYAEDDAPNPVNFYAETKIRSEEIALGASPANTVARLALVMGLRESEKGNSFLSDLTAKLGKGEEVRFAENEIRTPVDVITLGAALVELASREISGVIHLAGNSRIDRFQMALQIAEYLHFPGNLVVPVNSNTIPDRAPRPNDASLNNSKARTILKTPMLSLTEALALIERTKLELSA